MKGSATTPDRKQFPAMPAKLTFDETSRFCPIKLTNPLLIISFSDLQIENSSGDNKLNFCLLTSQAEF